MFSGLPEVVSSAAVADYDGDGKADLVVLRRNGGEPYYNWFLNRSRDGFAAYVWGGAVFNVYGDSATRGDYDGDGKWDIGVIRNRGGGNPYEWYIINSNSNTVSSFQWGNSTDKIVPQDYDGDGKTDPAVYRMGNNCSTNDQSYFYIQQSRDGFRAVPWGLGCDTLHPPADYIRPAGF